MSIELVLIVAVAKNGVIGGDNRLLWRLRSDMKRFRALTMGHPMIMGRKTYQSIGKPLPGRQVIVLTRSRDFAPEGVTIARAIEEAVRIGEDLARASGTGAVFVAGGGEIYAAFLPLAQRVELTTVDLEPAGDAYFPALSVAEWREDKREAHPKGPDDEAAFAFVTLRRRA